MKKRLLLLSVIFVILCLPARAQVYEMLYQGFETDETANYTLTPANGAVHSTVIYNSGERSIQLRQQAGGNVEFVLDTLDFTQNSSLRYISLRFDHICHVPINSSTDYFMGMIYYKLAKESDNDLRPLSRQEYNQTGSYSNNFVSTGAFSMKSYSDWDNASLTVNNTHWRSERFDLDEIMTSSVPVSDRKLIIKFVLRKRTLSGNADTNNIGWWLDNVKVSASSDRMVTPKINMIQYPHLGVYPNSRGARVTLEATTTVSAGINPDSVYLYYRVGSSPTEYRMNMTPIVRTSGVAVIGTRTLYTAYLPFCGFDTSMYFYCVVRDATTNANKATFPASDNAWVEYRYVRGTGQPGIATSGFTTQLSNDKFVVFPGKADHRSEWVYDSTLMANADYKAGAITAFRFTTGETWAAQTRPEFQLRMRNVPANYRVNATANTPFWSDFMQVVYDSVMSMPAMSNGTEVTVQLQDTFYYAGQSVLMQVIYNGTTDPPSGGIKMINTPDTLKTLYTTDGAAEFGTNPFVSGFTKANYSLTKRPAFIFYQHANQPLLYDAGISELVDPNYWVAMDERPGTLTVKMKNYGALPFQGIRITYMIDDTIIGHYDWVGSLNGSDTAGGGEETTVQIADNINIPAGFHRLKVWVEDTITAWNHEFRDHEPYNDTMYSPFIVCDGRMHGIRNIGGSNKHFNNIEDFLYALSRCGIDDTLIVRLAPGEYPAFTMPEVDGLSAAHYIVFESRDPEQRAVLFSDDTCTQGSIVNLENVANIRFRNLDFSRRSGALTEMVKLAQTSVNCRFENCLFADSLDNPPAAIRIEHMINSGFADSMWVENCTFIGGKVGVDVLGQASDIRSAGNIVRHNIFYNQNDDAINVTNQSDVIIEDNEMYDVLGNSKYVLMMSECYGQVSVQRNKVYTSHGAGGIGMSNIIGTETQHALVANNMVVNRDDGTAAQMLSPFNFIQGNYTDVVYNSILMNAPTRNNTAAATFGGGTLNNSRFMNNIVVSLDELNYAFSYQPLSSLTNTVSHNVYYSAGLLLNRYGSSTFGTIDAWKETVTDDSMSVSVNPNFLNGSLVDLRTYNRFVKGKGTPIATVTTDFYGTVRSATTPCPGAFEFASLAYDFEMEAMPSPLNEYCNVPDQVELLLRVRNSGIQSYTYGVGDTLRLSYQINGSAVTTIDVQQTVPADDTVTLLTGQMLQLPPNGIYDSTYRIKVWLAYPTDPNQTNDTNLFTVISRYHPAAPDDDTVYINYASQAVITPTDGVDWWSVYNNSTAPLRQSQIYWYEDSLSAEPFYVGHTYTTELLREGRQYYVRQRRSMPIVRITQVEILQAATAAGLTDPMPYWMLSRKAAVQLTNVGDATAYLEGDTLMTVSPTSALNNKCYRFGNIKIEPGQSLVVQFASNTVTDSSVTIANNTLGSQNVTYNSNIAFIYRSGGVVEDAVPFNAVITTNSASAVRWATQNVPDYVWSGAAVQFVNNVAGVIRTGFSGTANDWVRSSADNPMFLGTTDPSWVRYVDAGCEGDVATMTVELLSLPAADIELSRLALPESGCGLGQEDVTVRLRNYGTAAIDSLWLNYCAGGDTVTELVPGGLGSNNTLTYTFTAKLNLAFTADSLVTVRVWADSLLQDPIRTNDSISGTVLSLFTPAAPAAIATRMVQYATSDTISLTPPQSDEIPVWYDYNMMPVDTGFTHVTDILYSDGTMGVSLLALKGTEAVIGTDASVNGKTAYPSPYQPYNSYVRQQYIYSAADLAAAGLTAGNIYSLGFFLDSIYDASNIVRDSIVFDDYYISLGLTTDTIFASTSAWKTTTLVYERHPQVIYRKWDKSWVRHDLDTAFYWDGTSSLVVEVAHHLAAAITSGVQTRYSAKSNTTLSKAQNSALSPSVLEFVGSGTKGNNRPNLNFNKVFGCSGPITTYNVQLVGVPSVDVAMLPFEDGIVYNSCDTIALPVKIRNQGSTDLTSVKFYYYLDDHEVDSTMYTINMQGAQVDTFDLFRLRIAPGRHSVTAVASVVGDSIASNDTVRTNFIVRFCGGTYVIASDSTGDYLSFGEAMDTLNSVGIESSVVFNVMNGVYTEQVKLENVYGAGQNNSISFIGVGDSVVLTDTASEYANYIMWVDGVSNLTLNHIKIISVPAKGVTNANKNNYYGHALVLQNIAGVNLNGVEIVIDRAIAASEAENKHFYSCVALMGNVSGLNISNSVLRGGFYSVRSYGTEFNYANITINDNELADFAYGGVNLRDVSSLYIRRNAIHSLISSDSRGLTGLYLAQVTGTCRVERNTIYMINSDKGAKRGIQMENVVGTVINPVFVSNNMIGTYGTDSKGLPAVKVGNDSKTISAGIILDSSSSYVNVYFNTVRVEGTTSTSQNALTVGFLCGNTTSNLQVMNNIFSNFSYGYAYYVSTGNNVTTSDNNAYYSKAGFPLAWFNSRTSLHEMQTANGGDNNSVFDQPWFTATDDLHLLMTNFVGRGRYLSDVTEDIDGLPREQIPGPTIGASEMPRLTHDMAVVSLLEPVVPASPQNIESDPVRVVAMFYNNGRSTESNVLWYAYIEGHEQETRSANRNLGTMAPSQMKTDTLMMPTPLGIIHDQTVCVVLIDAFDTTYSNDTLRTSLYLAPAYNLQATSVEVISPVSPAGCSMQTAQVKITLKNVGAKNVAVGDSVKIGYHTEMKTPATLVLPTLPDTVEQNYVFTTPLTVGTSQDIIFDSYANLYPTDTAINIEVNVKGWCHHRHDLLPTGTQGSDTTAFKKVNSYYTPAPPQGDTITIPYGTWSDLTSSQVNGRAIRWYTDSTATTPFYKPSQYTPSCTWTEMPQLFSDTVYYLNCLSDKNCPSAFSTLKVQVAPLIPNDVAFEEVLAPLGGRVYMENDTVRVRIANYGTSAQSNIPVYYQLKQGNNVLQTVTETINVTVPAGQRYVYTFNTLLNIPTPTTAKTYNLTVWTDLPTDEVRRNDTIRTPYTFSSLAENTTYYAANNRYYFKPKSENTYFDITRVSWNGIDLEMPAFDRQVTDMAMYNNPEYTPVHVTRGTTDSIIIEVKPIDEETQRFRCRAYVQIDYNRNGIMLPVKDANNQTIYVFDTMDRVIDGVPFYNDSIFRSVITIPQWASLGYMRMRVTVKGYDPSSEEGHVIDFLIFVDEEAPAKDIAISQIVSPRSPLIRDNQPREVSFRMLNRGATPLNNIDIHYSFASDTIDSTSIGVLHWTGNLAPGTSTVVTLPAYHFYMGTTHLSIWHELEGDSDSTNNMLTCEYHRFHVVTLTMYDNFDSLNYWYAPTGNNEYSRNYWQHGAPHKLSKIDTAYSGQNVWVTDLNNNIVTGKRGNISYLYSPIIDISQIRADTLSFRLRRNLINNSSLHVEFFNYEGKWVKLDDDSVTVGWYTEADKRIFHNSTTGSDKHKYDLYTMPGKRVSGDYPENLQFRFVYRTPVGTSTTSAYGEGCAIDDFRVVRARRQIDAGVIAITQPEAPRYGQTIYPEVVVRNYGTDTIRQFTLGYTHYGTYLAKMTTITDALIPPDGIDTFLFDAPFTVTSDYPDSFYIQAFTDLGTSGDIYYDNDTTTRLFHLSPLDNDISAVGFLSPLNYVIVGDTNAAVTIRIRNAGLNPIDSATVTYILNRGTPVVEKIDFNALLGHPLRTMEYFNYTFEKHFRAAMGIMNIQAFVSAIQNEYAYNDTIDKRFEGITSVTDLAAAAIIVDTSSLNFVRIALVIENRGARGANNFEVGYWIDNDTSTLVRETYYRATPLPALNTGYYLFDSILPARLAPYRYVNAFVHVDGDNDITNDTTNYITKQYTDIEVVKVIVEENASNDCRVFLKIRNVGNLSLVDKQLRLRASINGNDLSYNIRQRVDPGQEMHIEFDRTIPKSPIRQYIGSAHILDVPGDTNSANNQTSVIEVINYMEGIPTVEAGQLVLEQNFPNPFTGQTTIRYTLPVAADVRFVVIDATGHTLLTDIHRQQAGLHTRTLDLNHLPSGIYFYGIIVDGQRLMRKMVLN